MHGILSLLQKMQKTASALSGPSSQSSELVQLVFKGREGWEEVRKKADAGDTHAQYMFAGLQRTVSNSFFQLFETEEVPVKERHKKYLPSFYVSEDTLHLYIESKRRASLGWCTKNTKKRIERLVAVRQVMSIESASKALRYKYLRSAALQNHPAAMYEFGILLRSNSLNKTSLKWIQRAAAFGYPRAHHHLFSHYVSDRSKDECEVGREHQEGNDLAESVLTNLCFLALSGSVDAQYYVHECLSEIDHEDAHQWFMLATVNGHPDAAMLFQFSGMFGNTVPQKSIDFVKSWKEREEKQRALLIDLFIIECLLRFGTDFFFK